MIKALHLDDRLIHGQVAISWTRSLGINLIFIVNDEIVTNTMRKNSLKLGIPSGVKYGFRSVEDGIEFLNNQSNLEKFEIMVLVDNTRDAYLLCKNIKSIKKLSIGGLRKNAPFVHDNLNLNNEDIGDLLNIIEMGIPVGMQPTPGNNFFSLEQKLRQSLEEEKN